MQWQPILSGFAIVVAVLSALFNYWHTERRFRASNIPVLTFHAGVAIRPGYTLGATLLMIYIKNHSDKELILPRLSCDVREKRERFPWPTRYRRYFEQDLHDIPAGSVGDAEFPDPNNAIGDFERFLAESFPDTLRKIKLPDQEKNTSTEHAYQIQDNSFIGLRISFRFKPNVHGMKARTVKWRVTLSPIRETISGVPNVLRRWVFRETKEPNIYL